MNEKRKKRRFDHLLLEMINSSKEKLEELDDDENQGTDFGGLDHQVLQEPEEDEKEEQEEESAQQDQEDPFFLPIFEDFDNQEGIDLDSNRLVFIFSNQIQLNFIIILQNSLTCQTNF